MTRGMTKKQEKKKWSQLTEHKKEKKKWLKVKIETETNCE